jgi:uncharacterized protein (TIGR02680 family)
MTLTNLTRHRQPAAQTSESSARADNDRASSRWRPTRAGILNVWRYYDEVFTFHHGRLLLRGPNGTGKSKALEVLLPFLFDASLRPNRLSTFGTSDRTMHWNLMGEGATGVTRVGYVWLELGRPRAEPAGSTHAESMHGGSTHAGSTDDGTAETWFTCGARLQASARTTTVTADFFTTSQRISQPGGLSLVTEAGQPLTRAALVEAIGPHGMVHPSATDYRSALRHAVFPGMSDQRFEALITALLQLRTPKLSQRLDPSLLSTLLSRALPPLDQSDIAELAEGFERLDRQREELRRLDDLVDAAKTVADQARSYSRRVLRAASAKLISATSTMDGRTRTARASEEEFHRVSGELEAQNERLEALASVVSARRDRIDGLTASESYKQGQHLHLLRRQTSEARSNAERFRSQATKFTDAADAATRKAEHAETMATEAIGLAERSRSTLAQHADQVSMSALVPSTGLETDAPESRLVLMAAIGERARQIEAVREALQRHSSAVDERVRAERDQDDAVNAVQVAQAAQEVCDDRYLVAVQEHADRLSTWADECTQLRLDIDELIGCAESEAGVLELVAAARGTVTDELATERARLATDRERIYLEGRTVEAELADRRAHVHLPPPAPHTRTADRTHRPGAPLWQVTSFAAEVPPSVQAGIEAALEGAGLLDAWIAPDGGLLDAEGHDVFALVAAGRDLEPGPTVTTLSSVLSVEDASPVPREVVETLLSRITFGPTLPATGQLAIGADGSWRLAALVGSWAKDEAGHIGSSARERARLRQIAALEFRLRELEAALTEVDAAAGAVDERQRQLNHEVAARPDHRRVAQAQHEQLQAHARSQSAQEGLARCRVRLAEAEHTAGLALRELSAAAAERGLPADPQALDRLERALDALRSAVETWRHAHLSARQAAELARLQRERSDEAGRTAAEAAEEAATQEASAAGLQTRLDAVETAIGSTYREVLAEIEQAQRELSDAAREQQAVDADSRRLLERKAGLNVTRINDASQRDEAVAARDLAAQRFRSQAGGYLAQDAEIAFDLGDREGVRAALEAARVVAATWPTVPFEPKNIADAQSRLLETLHRSRDVLAHRADLEMVGEDDVQVLSASMEGMRMSASGLLQILRTDRDSSRDDITSAEHDLFDTTLTGDTRRHLAARIRQAGDLVDTMNTRLDLVRTASNVAVRLTWQVDPSLPAGTRAARELLLKDPAQLSERDRQALHTFFRERIEDARAANTAASWEQQLGEVFDYTAWHQFVVKVDRAKGAGWEVLTKKLHGALSGGEKAIALHLPLFAAIAAHYQAVLDSPRVILLDEVFVGVDAANRGQVFALLAALDLDLVLTSDHEWCTYQELDGIAIHQLATGEDDDDAVTSVRFTWTGSRLVPETEPAEQ